MYLEGVTNRCAWRTEWGYEEVCFKERMGSQASVLSGQSGVKSKCAWRTERDYEQVCFEDRIGC